MEAATPKAVELSRLEVGQDGQGVVSEQPKARFSPTGERTEFQVVGNTIRLTNPFVPTDYSLVSSQVSGETKDLQTPLTSEQTDRSLVSGLDLAGEQPGERLIQTSEQPASLTGEQSAKWLHTILPVPDSGYWEVRSEGKGFSLKFRWHVPGGKVTSLTFPRISAERYRALKESDGDEAKRIISDRIIGHLDDLTYESGRAGKARLVATRLGVELEDDQAAGF